MYKACLSWLNPCPEHPFTQDELIKCTGISSGVSVSLPTESSNTIKDQVSESQGWQESTVPLRTWEEV